MAWEDFWRRVPGEMGWVDDGFGNSIWGASESTQWNPASGYASPAEYLMKTRNLPEWMVQYIDKVSSPGEMHNMRSYLDDAGYVLPNAFGGQRGTGNGKFDLGWIPDENGDFPQEANFRQALQQRLAGQGSGFAIPLADAQKGYQNSNIPGAGYSFDQYLQKQYQNPQIVDVPGVGQVVTAGGVNSFDWGLSNDKGFLDSLVKEIIPTGLKMYGAMTGIGSLADLAMGATTAGASGATGAFDTFGSLNSPTGLGAGGTVLDAATATSSLLDPSLITSPVAPVSDAGFDPQSMSGIENPANYGNAQNIQDLYDLSSTLPAAIPATMPHPGAPAATASEIAGTTAPASKSFWDTIGESLGIPGATLKTGFGAAGSLLEWLNSQDNQRYLSNMIGDAANRADPFASQRAYYQNMLKQSYEDPNFFKNNAVFGGLRDVAVSDAQRAAAARGYNNSTNVLHNVADRVQKTGMNYANQFQGQLAQNAGAGIAPGNAAAIQAQGAQSVVNASQQTNGAFGNLLTDSAKFFSTLV